VENPSVIGRGEKSNSFTCATFWGNGKTSARYHIRQRSDRGGGITIFTHAARGRRQMFAPCSGTFLAKGGVGKKKTSRSPEVHRDCRKGTAWVPALRYYKREGEIEKHTGNQPARFYEKVTSSVKTGASPLHAALYRDLMAKGCELSPVTMVATSYSRSEGCRRKFIWLCGGWGGACDKGCRKGAERPLVAHLQKNTKSEKLTGNQTRRESGTFLTATSDCRRDGVCPSLV